MWYSVCGGGDVMLAVLHAMPTFLSVQWREVPEEVVHSDAAYTACYMGLHH